MGYSRAVQAGPLITVAGCVGVLPDGSYPDGLAAQTRRCVERIAEALSAFDATLDQVIKVRIYTTDIARWEEIASVMGPTFGSTRPANLLVEVAGGAPQGPGSLARFMFQSVFDLFLTRQRWIRMRELEAVVIYQDALPSLHQRLNFPESNFLTIHS